MLEQIRRNKRSLEQFYMQNISILEQVKKNQEALCLQDVELAIKIKKVKT